MVQEDSSKAEKKEGNDGEEEEEEESEEDDETTDAGKISQISSAPSQRLSVSTRDHFNCLENRWKTILGHLIAPWGP